MVLMSQYRRAYSLGKSHEFGCPVYRFLELTLDRSANTLDEPHQHQGKGGPASLLRVA